MGRGIGSILLICILWATESRGQGVLFFLDGGANWPQYTFDEPDKAPPFSRQPGYFFGFSGLVLSRQENRPMFQGHMGIQSLSGEWFVRLRPGLSYLPDLGGGFYLHSHLGLAVNFPLHNGFQTFMSLDPELGLGYRGIVVKAGYARALSKFIDPSYTLTGLPGTQGKVHVFTIGLSFSPQVLFPSSEQRRNP